MIQKAGKKHLKNAALYIVTKERLRASNGEVPTWSNVVRLVTHPFTSRLSLFHSFLHLLQINRPRNRYYSCQSGSKSMVALHWLIISFKILNLGLEIFYSLPLWPFPFLSFGNNPDLVERHCFLFPNVYLEIFSKFSLLLSPSPEIPNLHLRSFINLSMF